MRTCDCNRVTGDTYSSSQCWTCWRYAHVQAFQRGAGLPATGKYQTSEEARLLTTESQRTQRRKSNAPVTPCNSQGDELSPLAASARGLGTSRKWLYCLDPSHPNKTADDPTGKYVCTCKGCGPSCSGYVTRPLEIFPGFPDPLPPRTAEGDNEAHRTALRKLINAANHRGTEDTEKNKESILNLGVLCDSVVNLLPPFPAYPGGHGRGIIWTCHSEEFWPMIVINCRILRNHLKCTMPVEVWYRGTCGTIRPAEVEGLDIKLIDRDAMARELGDCRLPQGDPKRGGWQAKSYAVTHTTLEEGWILDSDAMPCIDLKDIAPDCGFGFWRDMAHFDPKTNWSKLWPAGSNGVPPIQGGHLWFNRRKGWKFWVVNHWLNQHWDWSYPGSNDDQSCMRVALAAGTCPGYGDWGEARWVRKGFVCEYGGEQVISHFVRAKLTLPARCEGLPLDRERMAEFAKLVAAAA